MTIPLIVTVGMVTNAPSGANNTINPAVVLLNALLGAVTNEVSYNLTTSVDSPVIGGDVPGTTNLYTITPSANNWTLNGLIATSIPNGFIRAIQNASSTFSFNLGNASSGTTANRFLIAGNFAPLIVQPYQRVTLIFSNTLNGSTVS